MTLVVFSSLNGSMIPWLYLPRSPGGTKWWADTEVKLDSLWILPSKEENINYSSPWILKHVSLFHSRTACTSSWKNRGLVVKQLFLKWITVQCGILVSLAFVQAEHDGVSLDNFPPVCFAYQMEVFSWWAGMVPDFTGAFSLEFCCFCNYLDGIIQACSRLAWGKRWATQHESAVHMSTQFHS